MILEREGLFKAPCQPVHCSSGALTFCHSLIAVILDLVLTLGFSLVIHQKLKWIEFYLPQGHKLSHLSLPHPWPQTQSQSQRWIRGSA